MRLPRYLTSACVAIGLSPLLANVVAAETPLPSRYDQAYRSYLSSLSPQLRRIPWMVFQGVVSPPKRVSMDGRVMSWAMSCKPHDCGSNQVNVFFLNGNQAVAVYYINGTGIPHFLGGAGPRYASCVENLFATGGASTRC